MPRSTPIKYITLTLLLMVGCFVKPVIAAGPTLEVYETYHTGHRVAAAIDGLLKPGETIKVFGNKLIVRASDDTHEKIIYVLKEIDRAPNNFLISVRATDQYESQKRYTTAQLRYLDDSTVVHIDNQNKPEDGVIFYKGSSRDGKISMSVTSQDNLTTRQDNLIQQVRSLEGEQTFISIGDEIPLNQLLWANGEVLNSTVMDSANTGFFVRPVMSKGQVILEVSFQKQDRDNKNQPQKRSSFVSTRLRIPLNEWAPLAGVTHDTKNTQNGLVLSTKHKGNQQQGVEIKVETVN